METKNINPWLRLWTQPRVTLRTILDSDPKKLIFWLAVIGGIVSTVAFAAYNWYPPETVYQSIFLIIALIIAGGIFGLVHLYFSGWLLMLTGSWVAGKGNFTDIKCAVGWSNYPFIIANIFSLINLFLTQSIWLKLFFASISVVLFVWGFVIFMKLIGEAHRFSFWKAVLSVLIGFVLIFVALMLIALLIPLLSPLFQ